MKKSPLIARVESMEEIFLDDQDLDTSSDEAFVSPGCVADSIVGSDGTFIFFCILAFCKFCCSLVFICKRLVYVWVMCFIWIFDAIQLGCFASRFVLDSALAK